MRNRAAALLILTLTASCSRAPQHDQRSAAPVLTQPRTSTTVLLATPTSEPPGPTAATSTSMVESQPTRLALATDSSTAATRVVDQLIAGVDSIVVPDADLWASVVAGSGVIQTTVLAESADRATVAVSIAYDPAPGQAEIEPIGLRIELLRQSAGWDVIAIGYL